MMSEEDREYDDDDDEEQDGEDDDRGVGRHLHASLLHHQLGPELGLGRPERGEVDPVTQGSFLQIEVLKCKI